TLYQQLIGPFPYQKFALVENFWETGYGMPSFTLLGPQVIRFPFILHSSYPHELLHNWWGNSVYVDWARGNWCEGITVYLADHLIKEQRGQGLEYRRTSLQNFSAYVDDTNDFPLETFLSRKDAASEAIGYGKAMMVMHMLRRRFGDQLFQKALARFYTEMRWQKASFEDLRRSFEQVTGEDLGDWFAQWLTRKGAPQIELTRIELEPTATGSGMTLTLKQVQPGPVYQLDIPVIIYGFDQKTVITHNVRLTEREQTTTIALPVQPVLVEVDPDFDVFRRLDPNEVPPSLSQLFGADSVALVLPPTDDPLYGAYKALAETWALDQKDTFTVFEAEQIKSFPRNEAVWLFGRKNPFQAEFERGLVDYDLTLTKEDLVYEGNTIPRHGNSIILTCRVPDRSDQVLAWLFSDNPDAPTGLSRKLPHYGSYSVLVFEGDQPTNIVKGKWPVVGSPMMAYLGNPDESRSFQKPSRPPRPALAELPPVFSEQRIHDHVQFLASQEMAGRGLATPELDRAADYIAARFKEYGLDPAGDKDSFFQSWNQPVSGKTGPILMKNVIGLVAGSRSDWTDQAVVVCAHYDHLGHGWPVVHSGDEGKIHPGADDNASGVAVLLELARHFSHAGPPERNLIFIAFTAEECGRLGSQHFVDHLSEYPYQTVTAALNLDTVGRLGQGKVLVLGGASASEWRHIFMGCSYTTGVSSELVTQNLDSSDQTSFLEKGIPAVQLLTEPHLDYHRPGDTIARIDFSGLVRVATLASEAIQYLSQRPEPLTGAGPSPVSTPTGANDKTSRTVKTGTVPDFAFHGQGYRIGDITSGSAADRAGLQPGDIIIRVDDQIVASLTDFSRILKEHKPGDTIGLIYLRDGQQLETRLVLEAY
ncbi:M20/M25/M40 family metallo-hydrolase, partial [bacterium]|nr:M20/M25/M40 family metallo-hydrolase [bacterium]